MEWEALLKASGFKLVSVTPGVQLGAVSALEAMLDDDAAQ